MHIASLSVQAEHEAPVTAIGLAPDGLTIAVGTENGVIGCLDVPTHQYRTLLRSHTDTINAVAVDVHRCWHKLANLLDPECSCYSPCHGSAMQHTGSVKTSP